MSLPLATHAVTIRRPAATGDPTEATTATTVATGVAAVIGRPSGSERNAGGQTSIVTDVAQLAPGVDVRHTDLLVDDATGRTFAVQWVRQRTGLGLDHVQVGLKEVLDG